LTITVATCDRPRISAMPAWITTQTLNNAVLKSRVLAERRRAHLLELYQTGRWKRYFTEERFLMPDAHCGPSDREVGRARPASGG